MFTAACLYARHLGMGLNLVRMFWKPIISCIPMVIVVYLLSPFSVFLQIGAAIVTYAAVFYLFKGFLAEDRIILERVVPPSIIKTMIGRNRQKDV